MNFKDIFGSDLLSSGFNFLTGLATGQYKGRPQWRDIQFMNDVQNRLWPDEIKRQGDFLTGLAPSQAQAYNTYQDQTFMGDVTRRTEGVKQMAGDLGMSPWELTGQGGAATPLPSGQAGPSGGGGQLNTYLQGIMPLKLAQMQNQTSLKIAAMQNQTQRYGIDMAGGKSDTASTQNAATKAQQALTEALTKESGNRAKAIANETFLSNLRLLLDSRPTFSTTTGPVSMSGKSDTYPILEALKTAHTGDSLNNEQLRYAVSKLSDKRVDQLMNEINALANVGAKGLQSLGDTIMQFLPNMGKK